MTARQQEKPDKYCFAVTSMGRAATYWLAHSLAAHPQVGCIHGDFLPVQEADIPAEHREAFAALVSSMYKPGHPGPGAAGRLIESIDSIRFTDPFYALQADLKKNFHETSLDQYYEQLIGHGEYTVYGNVHGYVAKRFVELARQQPKTLPLRSLNLTRHPVNRFESYGNRYTVNFHNYDHWPLRDDCLRISSAHRALLDTIASRFRVDMSAVENWMFVVASLRNLEHYGEATITELSHVPCERLTSDQDFFAEIFRYLTHNLFEPDNSVMACAFSGKKLNRSSENTLSPQEQYEKWPPWKRFVFHELMKPEWLEAYARIGYECHFIRAC